MIKVSCPIKNVSTLEIFETCVASFSDKDKNRKLMSYAGKVELSATEYQKYIPNSIEQFSTFQICLSDKKDLISVYDDKFANIKFKKTRLYYEDLRNSCGGKCAICNIGVATSLDHYLPKTEFPLLSVHAANLVPECDCCNKNKLNYCPETNNQALLHPYFDDLSDVQWLDVHISVSHSIVAEYYNSYTNNDMIANRINKTMEVYKLGRIFSIQANEYIESSKYYWSKVLTEAGEDALKNMISLNVTSASKHDPNSWQAALYRGLEKDFEVFKKWLANM